MLSLISLALAGTLCNDGWWVQSEFSDACSLHNGIDNVWIEQIKQDSCAKHCQSTDRVEENSYHYIEENIPADSICFIGRQIISEMRHSDGTLTGDENLFIRNNIQQFFDNNFNWYFQPKTTTEFTPATGYSSSVERIRAFSKDNKYLYELYKTESMWMFSRILNPSFSGCFK